MRLVRLASSLGLAGLGLMIIFWGMGPVKAASPPAAPPHPVSAWGQLPLTRTAAAILAAQGGPTTFQATDFQSYDCFQVQASAAYTGTHSTVFVDVNEGWARSLVTDTAQAFDAMWVTLASSFGPPPDRDGDPRFTLLLLDIRDQFYHDPNATSYIPAYFDPINAAPGLCSNNRDMIYVDINPTSAPGLDGKRGMAHSLVNAIGWEADPAEEVWLNEAMAYLGEYMAGLGHRPEVANFLARPRNPLTGHTGDSGDAGQEYLWGLYLYEQYGPEAVYDLTQSRLTGLAAIEAVTGDDRADIYHRWTLANMADDGAGATPYGYSALDITPGPGDNVTSFKRPPATNIVVPPPLGWPDSPPYQRPAGLDIEDTFQGVGYYAADYYRLYPEDVPTWIVDGSDYQPFGQGVYSDTVTAFPNWTGVVTVPTVTLGNSYDFCASAGRSTGALGRYRYEIWPMFPPWWPGWDDGDDDEDHDCLPDWMECPEAPCRDTDGDGTPDYLDSDSDDDGLPDRCEAGSDSCPATGPGPDTDDDGLPDYLDPDDDNDTIPTAQEIVSGQACHEAADCDGDGLPNYQDPDSDNDGLLDQYEWDLDGDGRPDDTDGDGLPDVCDPDNDGDCANTADEGADPDGDGNPADALDENLNGIPDYLDPAYPGNACRGLYLPIIIKDSR